MLYPVMLRALGVLRIVLWVLAILLTCYGVFVLWLGYVMLEDRLDSGSGTSYEYWTLLKEFVLRLAMYTCGFATLICSIVFVIRRIDKIV